jgi:hypothetical protein
LQHLAGPVAHAAALSFDAARAVACAAYVLADARRVGRPVVAGAKGWFVGFHVSLHVSIRFEIAIDAVANVIPV